MATRYLIIPGVTNSGPGHWQTIWEKLFPDKFLRVQQSDWDSPVCDDWTAAIEREVREGATENVVLVAHSLGCTTVAQWARNYNTKIKGALLVAPSDVEAPTYRFDTTGFGPIPLGKLPFKSVVVGSANDEYVSIDRAKKFARFWGSEFIDAGAKGHINADAGFGAWPEGLKLLERLA